MPPPTGVDARYASSDVPVSIPTGKAGIANRCVNKTGSTSGEGSPPGAKRSNALAFVVIVPNSPDTVRDGSTPRVVKSAADVVTRVVDRPFELPTATLPDAAAAPRQ